MWLMSTPAEQRHELSLATSPAINNKHIIWYCDIVLLYNNYLYMVICTEKSNIARYQMANLKRYLINWIFQQMSVFWG